MEQFTCRESRIHTETQQSRTNPLQLLVHFGTESSFMMARDHQRRALWPSLFFSRAVNTASKAPEAHLTLQKPPTLDKYLHWPFHSALLPLHSLVAVLYSSSVHLKFQEPRSLLENKGKTLPGIFFTYEKGRIQRWFWWSCETEETGSRQDCYSCVILVRYLFFSELVRKIQRLNIRRQLLSLFLHKSYQWKLVHSQIWIFFTRT